MTILTQQSFDHLRSMVIWQCWQSQVNSQLAMLISGLNGHLTMLTILGQKSFDNVDNLRSTLTWQCWQSQVNTHLTMLTISSQHSLDNVDNLRSTLTWQCWQSQVNTHLTMLTISGQHSLDNVDNLRSTLTWQCWQSQVNTHSTMLTILGQQSFDNLKSTIIWQSDVNSHLTMLTNSGHQSLDNHENHVTWSKTKDQSEGQHVWALVDRPLLWNKYRTTKSQPVFPCSPKEHCNHVWSLNPFAFNPAKSVQPSHFLSKSRVSHQNGVSQLYIIAEIHHSGQKPLKSCLCLSLVLVLKKNNKQMPEG